MNVGFGLGAVSGNHGTFSGEKWNIYGRPLISYQLEIPIWISFFMIESTANAEGHFSKVICILWLFSLVE